MTSTRLSETRTSCRASWQSPSSSFQCLHSDRLYSGISAGTADMDMDRTVSGPVSGVAEGGACSRVGMGVDVSMEEAGDGVEVAGTDSGVGRGVGVGSAGVRVVGTGSEVADTGVEVTSEAGLWPMQAAITMRNARRAQSESLVMRVVASFSPGIEAGLQARNLTLA